MPTPRINGGIITDQMLAGSLIYFKIGNDVLDFGIVVSEGTVTLDPSTSGGTGPSTYYNVVGSSEIPRPVPLSTAEEVLRVLTEKATIVEIGLTGTGDPERIDLIHVAFSGSGFGWIDSAGVVDAAAMQTAIQALGSVTVPNVGLGTDDNTATPVNEVIDLSGATVTQVSFNLA